jgi:chromosome segregation ATPase
MNRSIVLTLSIVGLLCGCEFRPGEKAKLHDQVDSLKAELAGQQQMATALEEVAILMDSIDTNRDVLRTSMLEGTTYDAYVARMRDINDYVKSTHAKIEALEKSLQASKGSTNRYARTIEKLRNDLKEKSDQLIALGDEIEKYRNENSNLIQTVTLQNAEIADNLVAIQEKKLETDSLQTNIGKMLTQSKVDEAESYYLRAQAMEVAANRTHFAPKKKRATQREALELYRLAAFYGKSEAGPKVKELEKEVG